MGCAHVLDRDDLERYRDHLARLMPTGATFMIYGRLREGERQEGEDGPPGFEEAEFLSLFREAFELEWFERGTTQVEDQPAWTSAWFRLRRR